MLKMWKGWMTLQPEEIETETFLRSFYNIQKYKLVYACTMPIQNRRRDESKENKSTK